MKQRWKDNFEEINKMNQRKDFKEYIKIIYTQLIIIINNTKYKYTSWDLLFLDLKIIVWHGSNYSFYP